MMASNAYKQKKVSFSQKILAQTLTCVLSFISLNMLYSQQGFIVGPTTVCGGCHEYTAEFEATGAERYEWVVLIGDSTVINVGESKDVIICWDEFTSNGSTPQDLRIIVSITGNDDQFALETAINIQNPTSTTIIPIDAPPCPFSPNDPIDSNSCSKVCTNTTVNYTLDSLSLGSGGVFHQVQWEVSGAESFEVDFERNTVQVNWGSSGQGQISAFIFNGSCESFASTCVEILERPKIQLTTDPPFVDGELTICKGERVQFQNETSFADRYEWKFGELGTSTMSEPSFVFEQAGTHRVLLVAYNECNCLDSTSLVIKVLESESPSLSCLGTVCAGESINYQAEQTCGEYQWTVSANGEIQGGGGLTDDFVTVLWQSGSLGTIDLLVSDCNGFSACPTPTTFEIPILSDEATISGPALICEGAIESYHLPPYSGTSFLWQTSSGGVITDGQGTHEITVDWGAVAAGSTQEVIVQYENCFLGCGGSDTLEVELRPTFRMEGPIEICQGENSSFAARSDADDSEVLANWIVLSSSGDTVWRSTQTVATPMVDAIDVPGNYWLLARPDDPMAFCLPLVQRRFRVLAPPSVVEEVIGDTLFCLGQIHTYQVRANGAFDYQWEVVNGVTTEQIQGASINVEWGNNPPYALQVTRIARTEAACRSTARPFAVAPVVLPPITGPSDVCLGELAEYALDLPTSYPITWSVTPANTHQLSQQQDLAGATIRWGQVGAGTLTADACGQATNLDIAIHELPQPSPIIPAGICSNATASITLSEAYDSYTWLDESGNELGLDPSIDLAAGTYQVAVTDANACSQDTSFTLTELAAPILSISTPDFNVFCNTAPQARLFALEGSQGYQYQWFRDGSPVGTDSPLFTATALGRYWVEATNGLGCTTRSNEIVLMEDCSGGGGGVGGGSFPNCPAGANPAISVLPTANCNERTYESLSSGMVSGTATWLFDDPDSGADNTSNLDQPTHTYTRAGYFRVVVLADFMDGADLGGCFALRVDTIPIAAYFANGLACSGNTVNFTDLSTFLPGNGVASWAWDFGDPTSGAANASTDQNPSHTYASGGTYTVTLTITAVDGCSATMSKEILVRAAPAISVADLTATCEDIAKPFTVSSPEELIRVYWDMGDPGFSGEPLEGESIAYVYETAGDYTIEIQAVDIYGCENSIQEAYTSLPNNLAGLITSSIPNPICEGDSTLLIPPVGGESWSWWVGQSTSPISSEQIWVKESQVVSVDVSTDEGCQFRTAPILVEFQPSPSSFIRALELDENDQVMAYHYDAFEACAGSDVILEGDGRESYMFEWSNGTTGSRLSFTKESGNVLSPGTYDFSLLLTDNGTGCRQTMGPFTVTIHPEPAAFVISSDQSDPLCPGENINLSVNNTEPSVAYSWNTGEMGTSIVANIGGRYQAMATNAFGCASNSNVVEVMDVPAVDLFPSGCHARCSPDTICLPVLPDIVTLQWLRDGVVLTGPEATQPNLPITESGSYSLIMEDANGCSLESAALNLELFDGFGDIGGQVFYDVNANGLIDAADTTVSSVSIQLLQANVVQDEAATQTDEGYFFGSIPGNDYTLILDTLSLPPEMMADVIRQDTAITDCGEMIQVDWLLQRLCITQASILELTECQGNEVIYAGTPFNTDTSFVVTYQDVFGCDSLETVSIRFMEALRSDLLVEACAGSVFTYAGVDIPVGTTQSFTLSTAAGCDSIVNVQVQSLPTYNEDLNLLTCPGESISYNGVDLSGGQSQSFTLQTVEGCDSVVNVTVNEMPILTTDLSLSVCPGSTIEYGGEALAGGEQQSFTLTSLMGCDSIVNVSVVEFEPNETALTLQACSGETISYDGVELQAGQVETFVYSSVTGCDSTVLVTVLSAPTLTFDLETTASCEDAGTGTVQAVNFRGGAQASAYRVDDQAFGLMPTFTGQIAGAHTYIVRDENACLYEQAFVIPAVPSIETGALDLIFPCAAQEIMISPILLSGDAGDLQYSWEDGSTAASLLINSPGTYAVTISSECEAVTDNIEVRPEFNGNDPAFYVPNAFSPNEDGINEQLKVLMAEDVGLQGFDLRIFDRWGNQVFATDQIEQGWDGRFNGRMLDPAVFVWIMEATFDRCGQSYTIQQKGDVVLMW